MTPIFSYRTAGHSSLAPEAGFTLLEILLVLTLVSLAGLVLLPNMGRLDERTFEVRARQAVALLNQARRTAVVSGTPSSATFYAESEDSEDLPRAARNSVGSWYGSEIELYYQDSNARQSRVDEQHEFSFYPEGGSSGGTLLLVNNARQFHIEVDPFTGRIAAEQRDE